MREKKERTRERERETKKRERREGKSEKKESDKQRIEREREKEKEKEKGRERERGQPKIRHQKMLSESRAHTRRSFVQKNGKPKRKTLKVKKICGHKKSLPSRESV